MEFTFSQTDFPSLAEATKCDDSETERMTKLPTYICCVDEDWTDDYHIHDYYVAVINGVEVKMCYFHWDCTYMFSVDALVMCGEQKCPMGSVFRERQSKKETTLWCEEHLPRDGSGKTLPEAEKQWSTKK